MSIENVATLFVGVLSTIVPLFIFFKGKDRKASIIYGVIGLLAGPSWAISLVFFRESGDIETAIFWNKLIYANAILIAPLFFTFTRFFPTKKKTPTALWGYAYVPIFIFLVLIYATNYVIDNVILNNVGNTVDIGLLYYPWFFWFVSLMVLGTLSMVADYRKTRGAFREQAKYIVIGALFPALGTIPSNALLPMFGIYEYIWIGPFFLIIMNIIVGYGITRTRFFGLNVVIKSVTRPLLLFILLYIVITGFTAHILRLSDVDFSFINLLVISLIPTSVAYLIKQTLLSRLERMIFKLFDVDYIDLKSANSEFIDEISETLEIEDLKDYLQKDLKRYTNSNYVVTALLNKDSEEFLYSQDIDERLDTEVVKKVIKYVHSTEETRDILLLHEIEYSVMESAVVIRGEELMMLLKFMKHNGFQVIVPIKQASNVQGVCMIGDKKDGAMFTVEEVELVKSLIKSFSIAVGRSLLYEEVNKFASTLKEKVDEQTKELKDKVNKLELAQQRERDMLDILGHELRTPLSIIQNALGLIGMKGKKGQLKADDLQSYVDKGMESVKREIDIVENMLSATKLSSGQVVLNKAAIDMVDVVEDSIEGLKHKAEQKKLYIKFDKPENPEDFTKGYGDRTASQRVMDNLLSNAIKYTEKGGITISISVDKEYVTISVKDTGVGIPDEEIKKLGKKFYRVDQYLRGEDKDKKGLKMVRPGGTGIGLYVVYGLVREMKGKIWVDSEVGKGSTFYFSLPILKGEEVKEEQKKEADVFKRLGLKK